MKIFAIICTRTRDFSDITDSLIKKLTSYGVTVKVLVNQKSIYKAYERGFASCKAKSNDIVIFCHDDIEINSSKQEFIGALSVSLEKNTGIIGPAGTSRLGKNAVWWDQDLWKQGYHRGSVNHNIEGKITETRFGPYGQVSVLDGLFLAARAGVWNGMHLGKPSTFEGEWDFYDLYYTSQTHTKGLKNQAVPIMLTHYSQGSLVGRDSWHKNQKAFQKMTNLPLCV